MAAQWYGACRARTHPEPASQPESPMEMPLRRGKLHIGVQLGPADSPAHLIAAQNFRVRTDEPGQIWLLCDTSPSLRTRRKQEAMHVHAHEWAQAPQELNSIELPALIEDLSDIAETATDQTQWFLRVQMEDYGSAVYRVQPAFTSDHVLLRVVAAA